jgi:hypothetical protein
LENAWIDIVRHLHHPIDCHSSTVLSESRIVCVNSMVKTTLLAAPQLSLCKFELREGPVREKTEHLAAHIEDSCARRNGQQVIKDHELSLPP